MSGDHYSPLRDWGYGNNPVQARHNYFRANGYDYYHPNGFGPEHCFDHGYDGFYGHGGFSRAGLFGAAVGAASSLVQQGASMLGMGGPHYGAPPYGYPQQQGYYPQQPYPQQPPSYTPQPQAVPGYHAAYPPNYQQQNPPQPIQVPTNSGAQPDAPAAATPQARTSEAATPPIAHHQAHAPFGRLLHAADNCDQNASQGNDVSRAATMLQKLGYQGLDDTIRTGNFGPKDGPMDKAVHQFQEKHGLQQDGIIGPKTSAKLDAMVRSVEQFKGSTPPPNASKNSEVIPASTPISRTASLNIAIG